MYRTTKRVSTLFLAMLFLGQFVLAQSDNDWIKIAEKTVAFKAEKDVISPSGKERKVDKIRLKCIRGTVKIKQVIVEMSDGTKKEYDAKGVGVLTNGMVSLAWDLPDGDAELRKITLEYDSMGNMVLTKKAHVEIQGRRKN